MCPFVPLVSLLFGCATAAAAGTYMVTSIIAAKELEVVKKEAAANLELMMRQADLEVKADKAFEDLMLELKAEKASSAITSLAKEFLFRGDYSPIWEARQAKHAAASAASACGVPDATPTGAQVLK